MRRGKRIWAGEVPHKILSTGPGIKGGSIGPPSIAAEKAGRLEFSVHVHRPDRPNDDVICESVAPRSASAATASETVMAILCDLSPADAILLLNVAICYPTI